MYITFTFAKRIVFFLYMHLFSTYSQFCPIFDSKTDHEFYVLHRSIRLYDTLFFDESLRLVEKCYTYMGIYAAC